MNDKLRLDLVKMGAEHGIENLLFMVPMLPLRRFGPISLKMGSKEDYVTVPAKLAEKEHRKLADGYKVILQSTYPAFGTEDFYVGDLESLIREGRISVYVKRT